MNDYLTKKTDVPSVPEASPTIHVAIVEDDASVRQILCDWIREAEGFSFTADFGDAESALTALASKAPDVVLVDINLPGVSGIECVRRLKPRYPNTQFVMLTVYEDARHILDALMAGATGYLLKRTSKEALFTALREVHAGGSPMSGNIARQVVQSLHQTSVAGNAGSELSPREDEVLRLLARGYLYKEIADKIGISLPTVKTYIRRICEKLHVHSRAQAVALYSKLPLRDDS